MPFTGALKLRVHGKEKTYAAAVFDAPEWVKVPHGYSDGTHVDFKPQLGVCVHVLLNHNTAPKKWRINGRIPAETWIKTYWIPRGRADSCLPGMEVAWDSAGPKPTGKGWGKNLMEMY